MAYKIPKPRKKNKFYSVEIHDVKTRKGWGVPFQENYGQKKEALAVKKIMKEEIAEMKIKKPKQYKKIRPQVFAYEFDRKKNTLKRI